MTPGRLIAVVGPSGVGKDSVMQGVHSALPDLYLVRRVITRAPDLGGEAYDAVSASEFQALAAKDAFAIHWRAHGLHYGIPISVMDQVTGGRDVLANFSRKALAEAALVFPRVLALNITANPATLAARLANRGRESTDDIAKRLAQAPISLPDGLDVIELSNDGPLDQTVARAVALLQPASV